MQTICPVRHATQADRRNPRRACLNFARETIPCPSHSKRMGFFTVLCEYTLLRTLLPALAANLHRFCTDFAPTVSVVSYDSYGVSPATCHRRKAVPCLMPTLAQITSSPFSLFFDICPTLQLQRMERVSPSIHFISASGSIRASSYSLSQPIWEGTTQVLLNPSWFCLRQTVQSSLTIGISSSSLGSGGSF